MSTKHPIISVTGSSGAGTTSVRQTFENIFRREHITAAFIEGDAFHRYDRCDMERALAEANAYPDWIGYLSTTGVYGDREGGWVFETSPLAARSIEGARRVRAERDWLEVARGMGLTVQVFRLPGIYGPGRSAFERLAAGKAKRIVKDGQVFSRIHVEDIASGLAASIARPRAGGIYNLCDDEPAPPQDVIACAAEMMGVKPPPEQPWDPADQSRFYAENKRVSNARAKAELGWRPAFPTYREGLAAIFKALPPSAP